MTRHILTTVLAAVAAVGVGAQAPTALQPKQRADLFKKNRVVIERLVEQTVVSSRTPTNPVHRAESYDQILFEFSTAINRAKVDKDPGRVAELTNHLNSLLARGLGPTLASARAMVAGGTGGEDYVRARDHLLLQVNALLSILSDDPAARAALERTRDDLIAKIGK